MQSLIVYTIYFLSIFIPLTFTTVNYELFEFPKFIILLSGTLVISATWIIHYFQTGKLENWKTGKLSPISISILAILLTQTISTIFSINPYTSFWGYYSRYHQGLLTTICYTIIYFAAIKWLDNRSTQKLIKITVGTAFIVSLYGILEHFGIDKTFWVQDVQSRVFSTLGQPNWLAAYLLPNIFLTLYLFQTKQLSKLSFLICQLSLLSALLFTKSRSGILAFVFAYITYWLLLARQFSFSKIRSHFIGFTTISLLLFTLIGTPFTPTISSILNKSLAGIQEYGNTGIQPGTSLETGGTESGDIRKIVWTGAWDLIKKYPMFGTGPETFAYTYYWTRPITHNLTSEWDFLYNKAHNEYLNIAATTGMFGFLAYLYFHLAIFANSLKLIPKTKKATQTQDDERRHFYPILGASIVAFTITNFFGFSVIPVYFLIIILAALGSDQISTSEHLPHPISPAHLAILFVLIYPINLFVADFYFNKGKRNFDAGQYATALPLLKKAVAARGGLDLYHATLGETYAGLGQKDLALKEVQITTKLNPYHLNFYKSRAKIYLTLASLDPSFHNQAAAELEKARSLAPTDPKLAYNLGLVYTRLDKMDLAEQQLQDAISLKPNYQEPYYALTLLYEQTKQIDKIAPLLFSVKNNLATYSGQLREKIEKYEIK